MGEEELVVKKRAIEESKARIDDRICTSLGILQRLEKQLLEDRAAKEKTDAELNSVKAMFERRIEESVIVHQCREMETSLDELREEREKLLMTRAEVSKWMRKGQDCPPV